MSGVQTEQEMRESKAPSPDSTKELVSYIDTLVNREHDYGTCVYAMSLASVAAFNYVASKLGVTGFQASCADLDVLRRTRMLNGPFMIIDGEKMLYPQYDLRENLDKAMVEWEPWLAEKAKKLLSDKNEHAHPEVKAHWERLAAKAPTDTTGEKS